MAGSWRAKAQAGGMLLALLGWVSSCVTTFVPLWKSLSLDLNELEVWTMGLWQVCIAREEGAVECRAHGSFLALPPELRVSRLLMCLSNGLGLLGCLLAAPGLEGWRACGDKPKLKQRLLLTGGAALGAAAMATLAPVSWVAYNTVLDFWDNTVPDIVPRWEFGEATFLGWFAGAFLAAGGLLLACSACSMRTAMPQAPACHQAPTVARPAGGHHLYPKNADLVI
ncbi:putative claudin-25 [Falco rusticolus]|uniref:putative claudin-25 n=1 Tax=Falco rusticolus TaxID=120794 RepID=UPI000392DB75|nr:putative claudin-25 [Falco rusticolus]